MIYLLSLFFVLCLIILTYSLIRYLRAPISTLLKGAFISIRVLLVIVLILCFTEPVIKYQRLAPEKLNIPVLIDASASMGLFRPESTVIPLFDKLQSINSDSKNNLSFDFFLFGDTLRKFDSKKDLAFHDFQSILPGISSSTFHFAQNFIIISDANWSGKNSLLEESSDRYFYYVPLPSAQAKPYLQISIHDSLDTTTAASANFKLITEGFSSKTGKLMFSIFEKGKKIYENKIDGKAGSN